MVFKVINRTCLQSGQLLIELLVAMAIAAIFLPALVTGIVATQEGKAQQEQKGEAVLLLREAEEALRVVKEQGWQYVATLGTYHPVASGSSWTLQSGAETVNGYTRQITIDDVYRDGGGVIVADGTGELDPSTIEAQLSVLWDTPYSSSVSASLYLTRHEGNESRTETTVSDFGTGTHTATAVTNSAGGEVILGAGGNGDWCAPTDYIVAELNLNGSGTSRDVKALEGRAFTGTSGSSGTFAELGISNADPPVPSITGTIAGYDTRDVFIDGNYAYVATGDISKDIVIIDLTTNQEVGYFNDSNWFGSAQGVYVVGDVGYATIGFSLHTFDLSSKIGSRPELDDLFLWGTAYRLYVVGDYAYVALDWGNAELRLANVADPDDIRLASQANVNGARGQEVFVNTTGTRAYLATGADGSRREFFVINTDFPASSKNNNGFNLPIVGSYEANGMDPKGVTVVPGNKALLVGTGGEEYQVIDITDEANPVSCGGVQVNAGVYGVSAVLESDGDAYSYIVSGDSGSEFKIIEGGPGGQFADEGIYESAPFTATQSALFNRLSINFTQPTQTEIRFQAAVADAVAGSCTGASYMFVGPDKTALSFFTDAHNVLPYDDDNLAYENPARCFKYRAYLSTLDPSLTPVLYNATFNFSP